MARKKDSEHQAGNLMVQFRTGKSLGRRILELAELWSLSVNEVCRRMTILAVYHLTVDDYKTLERLARGLDDGNEFMRACDLALAALEVRDGTRQEMGGAAMSGPERSAFLDAWVLDYLGEPAPYRKIRVPEQGAPAPAAKPEPGEKKAVPDDSPPASRTEAP